MTRATDQHEPTTRDGGRTHSGTMKIAPSIDLDRARTLILISLGFWLLIGVLSAGVQAAIA